MEFGAGHMTIGGIELVDVVDILPVKFPGWSSCSVPLASSNSTFSEVAPLISIAPLTIAGIALWIVGVPLNLAVVVDQGVKENKFSES